MSAMRDGRLADVDVASGVNPVPIRPEESDAPMRGVVAVRGTLPGMQGLANNGSPMKADASNERVNWRGGVNWRRWWAVCKDEKMKTRRHGAL
jgi:hypothetical protein